MPQSSQVQAEIARLRHDKSTIKELSRSLVLTSFSLTETKRSFKRHSKYLSNTKQRLSDILESAYSDEQQCNSSQNTTTSDSHVKRSRPASSPAVPLLKMSSISQKLSSNLTSRPQTSRILPSSRSAQTHRPVSSRCKSKQSFVLPLSSSRLSHSPTPSALGNYGVAFSLDGSPPMPLYQVLFKAHTLRHLDLISHVVNCDSSHISLATIRSRHIKAAAIGFPFWHPRGNSQIPASSVSSLCEDSFKRTVIQRYFYDLWELLLGSKSKSKNLLSRDLYFLLNLKIAKALLPQSLAGDPKTYNSIISKIVETDWKIDSFERVLGQGVSFNSFCFSLVKLGLTWSKSVSEKDLVYFYNSLLIQ
ncbi:hypothetical protein GEMRC1_004420 [Eukaryota sp. GEM-RC1]